MSDESVLLIEVPEAEPLVADWRARYDPVAAHGVPAHITVLFPFIPPELIDEATLEALAATFAEVEPFDFHLAALDQFPGVYYLAPEPAEAFKNLTRAVVARFPEYRPYGGAFGSDSTPHLTVAQIAAPAEFDAMGAELQAACAQALPIRSRAETVLLMHNVTGPWTVNRSFRLGRV